MLSAGEKIIKAKVTLQKKNPFFSYLLMSVKFRETSEIETIGVNKYGDCYYNSKFIESLTQEELEGVLVHEILHIILEHLGRLGGRNVQISNISQDIVVNNLVTMNYFKLPKGGIIPERDEIQLQIGEQLVKITEISKKVWEEIYDILMKYIQKLPQLKLKCLDTHIRETQQQQMGSEEKEERQLREKWKKVVAEAYTYSKMQGRTPQGLERYIEDLLEPKIPWRYLLQKYIQQLIPADYTLVRPSKKSLSLGVYLPAINKTYLDIVVGVDTSSSISSSDLTEFISEVRGILSQYENVRITLIECDAQIQAVQEITSTTDLKALQFKGGGGTDFRPVFEYVQSHIPNCQLVIYLTDGWGDYPEESKFPTIWALSDRGKYPPFGQVVYIERND